MKKIISICLFILLTSFCLNAGEEPVKFATGEWKPYVGEKMENYGFASEVISTACKASGLNYEYNFYPWKRAEKNVLIGSEFATFPFKETPERLKKFNFSDTLYKSNYGILILKSNKKLQNFKYSKVEDLKGFRVGIVANTEPIKLPVKKAGGIIEEVPSSEKNIKKLEYGRLDFYIDDRAVIFQSINEIYNKKEIKKFVLLDEKFGEENEFKLMVSKKYPNSDKILKQFNKGLRLIKQNGEYQNILNKYGMK